MAGKGSRMGEEGARARDSRVEDGREERSFRTSLNERVAPTLNERVAPTAAAPTLGGTSLNERVAPTEGE